MRKLLFALYRQCVRLATGSGIDRFTVIHRAHQWVQRRLNPGTVEAFGKTLYLDPGDTLNLSIIDAHEPQQVELFSRLVREGDVVLDIGAHIGYYTLLFAQRVGPNGKVFSFEVHPGNAALLRKTIAESGYQHVTVETKGVWDETGTFPLYEASDCSEDHRMTPAGEARRAVEIDAVALDDYFEEGTRIDFIKMDIQGSEGRALAGMRRLLAAQARVQIVTEFEPWGLEQSGVGARAYLESLQGLGFVLYDLEGPGGTDTPVDIESLCSKQPCVKDRFTTLLCVKDER